MLGLILRCYIQGSERAQRLLRLVGTRLIGIELVSLVGNRISRAIGIDCIAWRGCLVTDSGQNKANETVASGGALGA